MTSEPRRAGPGRRGVPSWGALFAVPGLRADPGALDLDWEAPTWPWWLFAECNKRLMREVAWFPFLGNAVMEFYPLCLTETQNLLFSGWGSRSPWLGPLWPPAPGNHHSAVSTEFDCIFLDSPCK